MGTRVQLENDIAESDLLDALDADDQASWTGYDTDSDQLMIASTTSDDGDDPSIDTIDRCR